MNKPIYMRRGSMFSITSDAELQLYDTLPVGNYVIQAVPFMGYCFEEASPFELPPKYYGELTKYAERICNTYKNRLEVQKKPTGVLLHGEKGGGKTLLAKEVATRLGLPVILVNAPESDDDFKNALANLGPSVVIFDEFEKVYKDPGSQNAILTLLDGVYPSQCLFFIICNERGRLTDALLNRPGRLYYSFEYNGLSNEFIADYCDDQLLNKAHKTSVLTVTAFFQNFNFDMLQGLIEEMNRYGEPANEVIKYLNIKAEMLRVWEVFDVEITYRGQPIKLAKGSNKIKGHPFAKSYFPIYLDPTPKQKVLLKGQSTYLNLTQDNIVSINTEEQKFKYVLNDFEISVSKNDTAGGWNLDGPGPTRAPMNVEEED